jgi:hypothetical protein
MTSRSFDTTPKMQILDRNFILDPKDTSSGSWASPLLLLRFTEASTVKIFLFEKIRAKKIFKGKFFTIGRDP